MSVYEDIAAAKRRMSSDPAQTKKHNTAAKGRQVKNIVTTALKSMADGLTALDGVGSWDVDKIEDDVSYPGKKRAIENNIDHRQRKNKRRSLNIRAELTLMQDMVHEKTEECDTLKRVSYTLL